jgi:hypothetical protein
MAVSVSKHEPVTVMSIEAATLNSTLNMQMLWFIIDIRT